ncbi:ATP-binding cassette domain-containing protein [Candidatus Woesearchaeota archaeon]|nr:ATP-binding cassette domain-containing protein [Candidatus Woesearchaeota archaeon]
MKNAIELKGLVKDFKAKQKDKGLKGSLKAMFRPNYKEIRAVKNISFDVKKGELVGFIGPNGAGKSTAIKIMTGIMYPTKGKVKVLGLNPQKERKKLAYKIGTVFGQKPQLMYHLPAIDTFYLFSKIYEVPEEEFRKRLDHLGEIFEIKDFIKQPVRKLSLGQRMRCEIVASLLHKPEILFLDEPTIGLDLIAKKRIRKLIKDLNKKEKLTIILTSHDMEDVEKICKRLVIINKGNIVYDDTIRKIKNYLKYKVVDILFEDPIKELKLKDVNIISKKKYKAKLEIDTDKISIKKLLEHITRRYNIADMVISDPPVEEIIEMIYKK